MTEPSLEQLSSNQICYKDFRLSLPKNWCFFAPIDSQHSNVKLNFVQSNSDSYGRYEVIAYPHEKISPQQIVLLLKKHIPSQHPYQIDSLEAHKSNNTSTDFYILSPKKADYSDSTVPFAFLTLKNDQIHLLQFMLDPSLDPLQDLFNYVFHSLSYYDYSLHYYGYKYFTRQRKGHINFYQNSSTFRWYSDTPTGVVLQGKIQGKPAFLTIEKAPTEKNPVLIDESALPLLINNRRIWIHPISQILENGIYKMGAIFPRPGSESNTRELYTFNCLIDPQGEKLTEEQILNDQNLRLVFQRELFFPQPGVSE